MRTITCIFLCWLSPFLQAAVITGNNFTGALQAGMGGTGTALSGLWSAGGNAAGLAFHKKPGAGLSYENRFLVKELSLKSVMAALPLKAGTFGLTLSSFGYRLYSENKYGLSLAMPFGPSLAAAVQIDYLSVRIGEGYGRKGTAISEAGLQAKPLKGLTLGAHIFNPLHAKLSEKERIPTIFRLGAAYRLSGKVTMAAETEKGTEGKTVYRAGADYSPLSTISFRAGYCTPSAASFGFGYELRDLQLDLASSFHPSLGASFNISLHFEWD